MEYSEAQAVGLATDGIRKHAVRQGGISSVKETKEKSPFMNLVTWSSHIIRILATSMLLLGGILHSMLNIEKSFTCWVQIH